MGGWGYLLRLLRFGWGGGAELLVGLMLGSGRQSSIQTFYTTLRGIVRSYRRVWTH